MIVVHIIPPIWALASFTLLFLDEKDTPAIKRLAEGFFYALMTAVVGIMTVMASREWRKERACRRDEHEHDEFSGMDLTLPIYRRTT